MRARIAAVAVLAALALAACTPEESDQEPTTAPASTQASSDQEPSTEAGNTGGEEADRPFSVTDAEPGAEVTNAFETIAATLRPGWTQVDAEAEGDLISLVLTNGTEAGNYADATAILTFTVDSTVGSVEDLQDLVFADRSTVEATAFGQTMTGVHSVSSDGGQTLDMWLFGATTVGLITFGESDYEAVLDDALAQMETAHWIDDGHGH